MCFIRWCPKTALQWLPEQKQLAHYQFSLFYYFSWKPLRPEPAHGWTCPCQALQGTGSGEKVSKLAPTSVTLYYWDSQTGKCCLSASWLAEGSKEFLLCVPSLVFWPTQTQEYTKSQWLLGSLNSPNRLILLSQRSFSKTAGENWLYGFSEQAPVTWVHWSCCATLKALVLIFKTLKLLRGAHGRGPKPTTVFVKLWNWKGRGEVYRVKLCPQQSRSYGILSSRTLEGKAHQSLPERKEPGKHSFQCMQHLLPMWAMVWKETAKKKSSTKFP